MQSAEILDIKNFMQLLFQSESFDSYELVQATLRTDMDYIIEGKWNHDFYNDEEIENHSLTDYVYLPWFLAKDKIFSLIKGKKTPTVMKLVFKLSNNALEDYLSTAAASHNPNDIDNIHLNISFQNQKLNVICSISYKNFTLDRNFELEFFDNFTTFLKSKSIATR